MESGAAETGEEASGSIATGGTGGQGGAERRLASGLSSPVNRSEPTIEA